MSISREPTRLGFVYFPDTYHYRDQDLTKWLPELISMGANWIVLMAPFQRAIPERFLKGLLQAGIQPILHFHSKVEPVHPEDLQLLLSTYGKWGVQYVVFFDRPNSRSSWAPQAWIQHNLVERFVDIFLPLAATAQRAGLTPIFPALEPGGDYWDTAFLRTALESMLRRGYAHLLEQMVVGAYAWPSNRPLSWGAGGPEKWPETSPYQKNPGGEDHRGFHIFEWYQAIYQAVMGKIPRIILLGAGSRLGDCDDPTLPPIDERNHAQINLAIAQAFTNTPPASLPLENETVPDSVIACNFWLLSAEAGTPQAAQAWYQPDGHKLPAVKSLQSWIQTRQIFTNLKPSGKQNAFTKPGKLIHHYLLLPNQTWEMISWQLESIQPFLQKYQPTIGFSLKEAMCAEHVTLAGSIQSYPPQTLECLIQAGCSIQSLEGHGTKIASSLTEPLTT